LKYIEGGVMYLCAHLLGSHGTLTSDSTFNPPYGQTSVDS